MSNQVYYNENSKYLPSTGNNIFNSNADQTVVTTGLTAVKFQATVKQFDTDDITLDPTTGIITINVEGIYNFSATLNLTDATDPVNNDLDYTAALAFLPLSSDTTYNMATNGARIPARGTDTGSNIFYVCVGATFYCGAGANVRVNLTNHSATSLKVLGSGATVLSVQRVA